MANVCELIAVVEKVWIIQLVQIKHLALKLLGGIPLVHRVESVGCGMTPLENSLSLPLLLEK